MYIMPILLENILFKIFLHTVMHMGHSYVTTKPDKGRLMSGNLKASLTISISLCESYDGFDPTRRNNESTPTLLR